MKRNGRITGGIRDLLPGLVLPAVVLAAWHLSTTRGLVPPLIPTPAAVVRVLASPGTDLLSSGSLLWNTAISLVRVVSGFAIAAAIGIPLGILMGSSRLARRLMSLSVELSRPLSPLALVPLSLVVFRSRSLVHVLGLTALRYRQHILHEIQPGMLFVLFWGGFFPILLGTMAGVRSVRKQHLEAARILGAGRLFMLRHVHLPSAIPDIFTGLKLGMGRCWMVIIAAEMLPGTNSGLGYLVKYSYDVHRLDVMFAGIALIGVLGALLSLGLSSMSEWRTRLRVEER
ncbi:ABC transporter permease [Candidatus Fermentibacteria bacterium]|nr:ABC transporter permease [Candidatus Fermentibacteria bacterium]